MSTVKSPPKVTPAMVQRVLEDPPYWLSSCYLPAYQRGRYTLEVLAYAVTAALGCSPYDDGAVDEVLRILRALGYGEDVSLFADSLTNLIEASERSSVWT
ncbi:MAG: hypothetical protein WKF53_12400 [Rubrobacter sp.]